MLYLVTDPRSAPVRWVDLSGVDDSTALVPRPVPSNRNLSFERKSGARNLAYRNRRMEYDLQLNLVPGDVVQQIYELAGLSARNRSRRPVMCLPNLGPSTVFSAPLSRSTKAWALNRSTHALDITAETIGIYQSGRFFLDEFNRLNDAGTDPRFEPGLIGQALRNEKVWPNLISTSHPAGPLPSNPIYTARAGAPTIQYDEQSDSPVEGRDGADKVVETQTAVDTEFEIAGTGAAQIGRVYGGMWVRGDGAFQLGIEEGGAGATSYSASVDLDPCRWQYVTHSHQTISASSSFKLIGRIVNTTTRLRVVYAGPGILYQTGAIDTLKRAPQHWNERATAGIEQTSWSPIRVASHSQTWAVLTTVPEISGPDVGAARLLELDTGDGYIGWTNSGAEFQLGGQVTDPAFPSITYNAQGQPALLVGRYDSGGTLFSITVAILNPDGTTIDVGGNIGSAEPGTASASYSSFRIPNGSTSTDVPPNAALVQCARLDADLWTDAELTRYQAFALSPGFRAIRYASEGRLFEIDEINLEAIPGRWDEYAGSVGLVETEVIDPGLVHAL